MSTDDETKPNEDMKDEAAKEAATKAAAAKEEAAKAAAAKEAAAKAAAAKEEAAKEATAKEAAAKETASKETAAKEKAREVAAKEAQWDEALKEKKRRERWTPLLQGLGTVAVIAILVAVLWLIGRPLITGQEGVLDKLRDPAFARGIITYVITLATIGIAAALVAGILLGVGGEGASQRFEKGKEILALLIGVLGTIVGFYYGAADRPSPSLVIEADTTGMLAADSVRVLAHVSGGTSPYRYTLSIRPNVITGVEAGLSANGWIRYVVERPDTVSVVGYTLRVEDAVGNSDQLEQASRIVVPGGN